MLKLQFKDQRSEPIWVVDKSFAMGSADDNQLVINDASISPQHARIVCSEDTYTLRDLGSTSGVYVNNQRINKRSIGNGDNIRLGQIDLVVIDPFVDGNQSTWSLVACSSWLSGQEFNIPAIARNTRIKVGRSSHCDIIFPGTHLSREHIELQINGDHLVVKDLDSANGTFINDIRTAEGKLYPGDKLRLDVYSFKILGPVAKGASPIPSISQPPKPQSSTYVADGNDDSVKRWKTRPTSPGNRNEQTTAAGATNNIALIAVASLLSAGVLALGAYLVFG
jgi:pSer/pThr/pTyr-binding forkhead associated (FHA) protein